MKKHLVLVLCECKKCGHKWYSKSGNPKVCPKCKSYKWKEG